MLAINGSSILLQLGAGQTCSARTARNFERASEFHAKAASEFAKAARAAEQAAEWRGICADISNSILIEAREDASLICN